LATEKIRIDYQVIKKQLDAANIALKEAEKRNNLLQKEVDETTKKFKKQDKQLAKTNKAFSGLGGQLQSIANKFQIAGKGAGDLAVGMFRATAGTAGLTRGLKLLKIALVSTGIGAILVALGSLAAAFTSSEKGSDKLNKILSVMGVIVGNVSDIFADFGLKIVAFGGKVLDAFSDPGSFMKDWASGITKTVLEVVTEITEVFTEVKTFIEAIFTRDFATAGIEAAKLSERVKNVSDAALEAVKSVPAAIVAGYESATIAVADFIKHNQDEIAISNQMSDDRAATNRKERIFWKQAALAEREVADLRLKGRQEEEFTALERVEFLKKARDVQNDLAIIEREIAEARFKERVQQNEFSKSTRANKEEEVKLEVLIIKIETARLNSMRQVQREIIRTLGQAKAKEAQDIKNANALIELEQKIIEAQKQAASDLFIFRGEQAGNLELAELERTRRLLLNDELTADERILIALEFEAAIKEIRETAAAEEEAANKKSSEANKKAIEDELELRTRAIDTAQEISNQGFALLKGDRKQSSAFFKTSAIAEATINAGLAASRAFKDYPFPASLAISALALAAAISQIHHIRSVEEPVELEKGGRIGGDYHSAPSGGTHVLAEKDEFMMSRKATSKYGFDFMDKINNLELNDLTMSSDKSTINIIDTKAMAEQLKSMPQNIMNVDSEGFTMHQIRGQHTISQKIERYST